MADCRNNPEHPCTDQCRDEFGFTECENFVFGTCIVCGGPEPAWLSSGSSYDHKKEQTENLHSR